MPDKPLVINERGQVVVKEPPKSCAEELVDEIGGWAKAIGSVFGL